MLITTPGAPDANSYASIDEADAYNAARPFATSWAALDAPSKEAALTWATLLLDSSFIWTGAAANPCDQALCWPRTGMFNRNGCAIDPATIPRELKYAQSEYARQLTITDLTATNDAAAQGIASVKAGSVSVSFTSRTPADTVALMNQRYAYLSKNVPDAVRLILVPSWYQQAEILISQAGGAGGYNPFYFSVDR